MSRGGKECRMREVDICEEEVLQLLEKIKSRKSAAPDGVPVKFINSFGESKY